MTTNRWLAMVLAAGLVLTACGDDASAPDAGDDGRLAVVASFYPVAELVTRVGGARVDVTNLTPAGVEPHDLELTPRQVDRVEDADLVIYLGQGFQPALEEVAERRDDGTVDVLEGIDLAAGAAEGSDDGGALDPHFWLDPTLLADAVEVVAEALADASPEDAATFTDNARAYEAELTSLDTELEQGLADCDRKEVVTSHAAFFYLARRYGLTQRPIAGLSPEAEPDADRLATLADEIDAEGITTVFYEELVSRKVADALAREAGVRTAVLNPIEGLSQDAIAAGDDYAAVMRDNLRALRAALGCR